MPQAFALKAEFEGEVTYTDDEGAQQSRPKFVGATVHLTDGHHFDVAEQLAAHGGVLVTEDPALTQLLRQVEALKEVATPDKYELVVAYELLPVAVLREQPAARLIGNQAGMRKEELIARMSIVDQGGDGNAPLPENVTAEHAEQVAREQARRARRAGARSAQGAAQTTEETEEGTS